VHPTHALFTALPLYCSADHRDLHSFPTRRSSDLTYAISFVLIRFISRYREYAADRGSAIITGAPEHLMSALQKISSQIAMIPQRSEEHTSELQSLRHLVCRLLLEKKKKNPETAFV